MKYGKWPDILNGILHGYDSINRLTTEEKKAVYHVICAISMVCISYFGTSDEYRELAKTSREMIVFISNQKEQKAQDRVRCYSYSEYV